MDLTKLSPEQLAALSPEQLAALAGAAPEAETAAAPVATVRTLPGLTVWREQRLGAMPSRTEGLGNNVEIYKLKTNGDVHRHGAKSSHAGEPVRPTRIRHEAISLILDNPDEFRKMAAEAAEQGAARVDLEVDAD